MEKITKQYGYYSSCLRHLKNLEKKGIVYYKETINQLDEGCFELEYEIILNKD